MSFFGVLWPRYYARPEPFAPQTGPPRDIGSVIISHVGCVFQISFDRPVTGSEIGKGREKRGARRQNKSPHFSPV